MAIVCKAVICRLTQTTDKDTNPCEIIQLIRDDSVSGRLPYAPPRLLV